MTKPLNQKPFLVGIAGGTGSGKTTLTRKIVRALGDGLVCVVVADDYYKDLSHLTPEQRSRINFDHPDALETALLLEHLEQLKQGSSVKKHVYDFSTHTRTSEYQIIEPRPIVLVDGILIFAVDEICRLFDLRIFVHEEAEVRLERRLRRDMQERGRTHDSVMQQYRQSVKPMHDQFVEPSRSAADILLMPGDSAVKIIDKLRQQI